MIGALASGRIEVGLQAVIDGELGERLTRLFPSAASGAG